MKLIKHTLFLIIFFSFVAITTANAVTKGDDPIYSERNISNYFSGIISTKANKTNKALNFFKKTTLLKSRHLNYNVQFLRTLISLEKFNEAFIYANSLSAEESNFTEANLLIGIDAFLKKNYIKAEKYFQKLNNTDRSNFFFQDLLGNSLIAWVEASKLNEKKSFETLKKIPVRFENLKKIQEVFLACHFELSSTDGLFKNLIENNETDFSRYNFFFTNYLLYQNNYIKAQDIIAEGRLNSQSNLLINQTYELLKNKKIVKIKSFFNCKAPNHVLAEFFYIIANFHSTEKDFLLSNFYLKISLFLNNNFLSNNTLLAENYMNQKKFRLSKKIYESLKEIGEIYSWHSNTRISYILSNIESEDKAFHYLEKELLLLKIPNYNHYYDLANLYKDHQNHKKAVKYYSLALKKLKIGHELIPKILDKRGTSYERMGIWLKAEEDLKKSLEILPNQPYVLNYLAYSWIDKKINIDKSLEMLRKANDLRKNDGYIIDSLGWAFYLIEDYLEAEKFLRKAVQLLPTDPIINDHYADTLWKLNKPIQARYFWKYVLNLERTENDLKKNIAKKLIFGVFEKS
tara:strand:- start:83 stop:1801 length:1719 start_codon:yes stop_codon:yes gene_type:complete